jgi:hypothetical protein
MAGLENPHQGLTGLDFRRNADITSLRPMGAPSQVTSAFPSASRLRY